MRWLFICFLVLWFFSFLVAAPASAQTHTSPLIIDHHSVALFDQIPAEYIQAASNLKLMLRHASIGDVMNNGLECLSGIRTSPAICNSFPENTYLHPNWSFQNRGNPGYGPKIDDFITQTQTQINDHDLFMFKFCYIDYANPWCPGCSSPWDRLRDGYTQITTWVNDQNQMNNTNKQVVWWTMPLTRTTGVLAGDTINQQIRQYVRDHNLILFDIADIEAYDISGQHITDTQNLEIVWQPYCGEQNAGGMSCHPDWPDNVGCLWPQDDCEGGTVRIDKAFWVLIAQLAGWDPSGSITPTPLASPQPTGGGGSPDLDGDGDVDFLDLLKLVLNFNSSGLGNFNLIGPIDIFDFNLLLQNL